jgi:hypothetical protein
MTQDRELVERWHATFRHSAGRLGSRYLSALRDDGKILGWRTGTPPRVLVPPKDLGGDGEFVEVGPGAGLLAFAPTEWLAAPSGDGVLGLVALDGADTPLFARVRAAAPAIGMRLIARFGGATDIWFEPA